MEHEESPHQQAQELLSLRQKDIELTKAIAAWQDAQPSRTLSVVLLFDRNLRYLLAEGTLEVIGLPAAAIGKTIWEALPAQTCTQIEPIYRAGLAGKTTVTEQWYNNYLYQIHTLPVKNAQGEIFAGMVIAQNITQQKLPQADRQKSEARYRSLVKATSKAVWTTNTLGLVIEDLPSWRSLTGQSYEEIQGWGWLNAIHPDDRKLTQQRWTDAVENKSIYQHEYRLRIANGTYRFFLVQGVPVLDENGEIQEWVGTLTDISDRNQSQIALQDSKERLRLALEGANLGMWDYDILTGRLLWSLQCKRLFGLVPDDSEITHEIFLNALHPEDRAWVDRAVTQAINEKSDYDIEYRTLWIDGTVRWIAAKGRAIYNDTGQPIRMLGTTQDITERKEFEAERASILAREQAARAESEAANRMKDEFLAIVSHELRTPLNSVLGWAELLRTRKFDSSKTAKAIETILRNAKLQVQLIEDLLDISRMMRGKIQLEVKQVNLISVIEAALDTVRLAAEAKSIDFKFTILDFGLELNSENLASTPRTKTSIVCASAPNTLAGRGNRKTQVSSSWRDKNPKFLVLGDVCRLQQIVWNLLSNAIKFTPNGGRVEVRLSIVGEKDKEELGELGDLGENKTIVNSPQASYPVPVACIQVIDTGKGIKPDFLNYVFERFRQADSTLTRSFGGLGLGLAIARQLVELHGGTICVASPGEGKGATFTVKLPLLEQTTHYSQLTTEKEKRALHN